MPLGSLTINAEPGAIADALLARLPLTPDTGDTADIIVTTTAPAVSAHHVILHGPVTDAVDTWDIDVPPQTVAGALWLSPDQPDAADAAVAWLTLRLQTPTTPLSDLTDNNGRALRWSVVSATTVPFTTSQPAAVEPAAVKAWVDAQPAVLELGEAVQRVGGDTAEAVMASVRRFRTAVAGLRELGASPAVPDAVDVAVAEHLRQVQRTGFARWRGGKARAASQAALQDVVRAQAKSSLQEVLAAREADVAEQSRRELDRQSRQELVANVQSAALALVLPMEPDFDHVPRSWGTGTPQPRRYVFVHEDHLDLFEDFAVTVRGADMTSGQAVCALVASGFSLPALRTGA